MKLTNSPLSTDFMQSRIRPSNFPSIPHPGNNRRLIRLPPNPMLDPLQGTQFIKLRCVATTIEPCWVKHKKFKNILSNWQFSCSFFGSPVFCHHRASSSLTFLFCTLRRNILHFRWGTVRIMWGFFGLVYAVRDGHLGMKSKYWQILTIDLKLNCRWTLFGGRGGSTIWKGWGCVDCKSRILHSRKDFLTKRHYFRVF